MENPQVPVISNVGKKRRIAAAIFFTAVIIWCAVIYSFSLTPGTESFDQSIKTAEKVHRIIDDTSEPFDISKPKIVDVSDVEDNNGIFDWLGEMSAYKFTQVIRKTAHIFEYSILAILLYLAFSLRGFKIIYTMAFTLSLSFLVASIDELIQTKVVGRCGLIQDVFIDFSATVAVTAIYSTALFIIFLIKKRKKRLLKQSNPKKEN